MDCLASTELFGIHNGRQFKGEGLMACGCDAGVCERHAKAAMLCARGPKYELGQPKLCKNHAAIARRCQ